MTYSLQKLITKTDTFDNVKMEDKMEDKIIDSLIKEIKYPCGQHRAYGCGLDFNQPKYKADCYFYEETKDMGATIIYCCAQSEIKWGYCPCEKCDKYISNAEASRIIRNYIEERRKQNDIEKDS